MIFYTYQEQKGLLKPAAVVMQLHHKHMNVCFAQSLCKRGRVCVVSSNKETRGFCISGLENICCENSVPFALQLKHYLFTHPFSIQLGRTLC